MVSDDEPVVTHYLTRIPKFRKGGKKGLRNHKDYLEAGAYPGFFWGDWHHFFIIFGGELVDSYRWWESLKRSSIGRTRISGGMTPCHPLTTLLSAGYDLGVVWIITCNHHRKLRKRKIITSNSNILPVMFSNTRIKLQKICEFYTFYECRI